MNFELQSTLFKAQQSQFTGIKEMTIQLSTWTLCLGTIAISLLSLFKLQLAVLPDWQLLTK